MKLKSFFKPKSQEPPSMMTQKEVEEIHGMLAAIVTGQTPIRFSKLKAGQTNPVQMLAEVFACVLRHPNGREVARVIENFKTQLKEFYEKQAEQEDIQRRIQEGHQPPTNGNGVA